MITILAWLVKASIFALTGLVVLFAVVYLLAFAAAFTIGCFATNEHEDYY